MTHDEIISNLFAEYDKVSKKRVVELFLSSLSTRDSIPYRNYPELEMDTLARKFWRPYSNVDRDVWGKGCPLW